MHNHVNLLYIRYTSNANNDMIICFQRKILKQCKYRKGHKYNNYISSQ